MTTQEMLDTYSELNDYIQQREVNTDALHLTDEDMRAIFKCSRTTLYRARVDGRLPYQVVLGSFILYNYSDVLIALRTNRFKLRGLNKVNAIERLATYKQLLGL